MEKGDTYKGFTVQEDTLIEEIQVNVIKLIHEKSGAHMFHLKNDDEENVFSLAFKTYPKDDTGVAHILEHTVLCGSKKYPVRDPFFLMTRRSLNTFMNALTSKIWTAYPAASMNKQDFYNLLEVYLDATFNPLLREESFCQEASRLEFDENKKLMYKGVVFNEMKGSLANPYSRLFKEVAKALYLDSPYASDSGGDPKNIVELTHEELIEFHKTYYHPSRCLFYFYGNIDTKEHIDALDENVFKQLKTYKSAIPALSKIQAFNEPKELNVHYPGIKQEGQKQDFITFSWVMMDIDNQEELLALNLLDSILMQTDASLLKNSLITSSFCQNADSMIDTDTKQIPYMIIANGCDINDFEKIKKTLFSRLEEISQNPIEEDLIEASLTALEIERTEITSGSSPYGLELFYRCVLPYMQGANYIRSLQVHALFKKLKEKLKEANYLQNIIKKYFLENKHFVALKMSLDETMQQKDETLEKNTLLEIQKKLSKEKIHEINQMAKTLKKEQEQDSNKDKNLLPGLPIDAISKKIPYFNLAHQNLNNLDVYFHNCFCNHFVYLDLSLPLSDVSFEDLHDLKLFTSVITELGTKDKSYKKQLIEIQNTFSSLSCSIHLNMQKESLDSISPTIVLSAGFLQRKGKKACNLMSSIMSKTCFNDTDRLKELIASMNANLQNSMSNQALSLALKESIAPLSSYSNIKNHLSGLSFIQYVDSIASNIDQEVQRLEIKFKNFLHKIFHFNNTELIVSTQKEYYDTLIKEQFYELGSLKQHDFKPFITLAANKKNVSKANILALPIAHNALGLKTINCMHQDSAALALASYIIKNNVLHTEIREKGGAYGSGAKYTPLTGMFQFYSYRDPNITRTYKMFAKACEQIQLDGFTNEQLLEAKLGYFSDNESKIPPAARAYHTFANEKSNLSKDFRDNYKQNILKTSKQDIQEVIAKHLIPQFKQANFICYTNESMAMSAKKELEEQNINLELYSPFSNTKKNNN